LPRPRPSGALSTQTSAAPAAMLLSVPTRKALRLRAFDYSSAGAYFVTVCTHERRCILAAKVLDDHVILSSAGRIVERQIEQLPQRLATSVDSYVVMPNHVHLVVHINGEADERARQASPLRDVVGGFKSGSSREINAAYGAPGAPLWQRGYYDHVIRDEDELNRAREYIQHNPIRWAVDPDNV
jgi:putative transposase